jgi:hypothetical protein
VLGRALGFVPLDFGLGLEKVQTKLAKEERVQDLLTGVAEPRDGGKVPRWGAMGADLGCYGLC